MLKKDKSARDAFTLSLGGARTINSFAIVPAIAHDRLRQDPDGRTYDSGSRKWRLWTPRRVRVA